MTPAGDAAMNSEEYSAAISSRSMSPPRDRLKTLSYRSNSFLTLVSIISSPVQHVLIWGSKALLIAQPVGAGNGSISGRLGRDAEAPFLCTQRSSAQQRDRIRNIGGHLTCREALGIR